MRLERKVGKAITFLARIQKSSGQFPIYLSNDSEMRTGQPEHCSVFGTAVVAHALLNLPAAAEIIKRAAAFLESEQHPGGVWKYWTKKESRSAMIAPDVDDTAFVSLVLRHLGKSVEVAERRILNSRDEQGRFRTWIFDSDGTEATAPDAYHIFWTSTAAKRDDVDAVVNANVLHFLGRREETSGAIQWLAEQHDILGAADKWYQDGPARCWGFGRVAELLGPSSKLIQNLRSYVIREIAVPARKRPAMFWAMLGEAAINVHLESALIVTCAKAVVRAQRWNGSWPRAAFYFGTPERNFVWGGESISTAICAAFLDRVDRQEAV